MKKDREAGLRNLNKILDGSGFSYVSGYTHCDGFATIRCNKCGTEFVRSCVSIRKGKNTTCPKCKEKEKEERKSEIDKKKRESSNLSKIKAEIRKEKSARAKQQMQESKKRVAVCPECGKEFVTYNKKAITCSKQCSKKRQNRKPDRRLTNENIIDKDITLESLYKRDSGVCYLCGGKCNLEDYVVRDGTIICGDWYPSIEHIIPLSKGGKHAWKNVMLAHRKCNYIKRDHMPPSFLIEPSKMGTGEGRTSLLRDTHERGVDSA